MAVLPLHPVFVRTVLSRLARAVRMGAVLGTGVWLAGCGGGEEQAPASRVEAAASAPDQVQRPLAAIKKIKAGRYLRKGVTAIAMAPDGSVVAAADAQGAIRLLDSLASKALSLLVPGNGTAVVGLLFSPDSRNLLGASRDSSVSVWNVATGLRLMTLHGIENSLRSLAMSADATVLAASGEDTRVMVWNGTNGRLQKTLTGAADFINAVGVSPDGRLVAAGGAEARIFIWNTANASLVHTLLGHADEVNALAFSPSGNQIASAGEDGKLILWDPRGGAEVQALTGHGAPLQAIAYSPDGSLLAGGGEDGTVTVWDLATGQVSQQFAAPGTVINAVAFAVQDKTYLIVGDDQNRLAALKLKAK